MKAIVGVWKMTLVKVISYMNSIIAAMMLKFGNTTNKVHTC